MSSHIGEAAMQCASRLNDAGSQEGGLAAQMAAMQHTLAAIETKVAGLEADVTKLMHRTSLNLLLARQYNSNATDILHALQPVPHPDTGALPADGLFPATLAGEC
jgi:hypothetical protein